MREELDEERLELPERVDPLLPERVEPLLRDRVEPPLRDDLLEAELRDRLDAELFRPPPLRLRLWDLPDDSAISHSFRALKASAV